MPTRRSIAAEPPSPPPRARVRRGNAEDHERLRREILDAAFAAYQQQGLAALTMRSVAQAVNLSPMALYRYFTDKAALLRGLWEFVLGEAQQEVGSAIAAARGKRERLRASVDAYLRYWEAHPDHFRLVFMTEDTMRAGADTLTGSPVYRAVVDLSRPLLQDLAGPGADPAALLLARDLRLSLMFGYLHARLVNTRFPWSDLDALRERTVEAVVEAVARCARTPLKPAGGRRSSPR
jgi:AcrR family transcriptional regulator